MSLERLGDEERRLMHLVPAPAVKLMKGRVLSRPGMKKCLGHPIRLQREREEEAVRNQTMNVFMKRKERQMIPDDKLQLQKRRLRRRRPTTR